METLEYSYIIGSNAKCYYHLGKVVSYNINHDLAYNLAISQYILYSREMKNDLQPDLNQNIYRHHFIKVENTQMSINQKNG